ncbi:conserved hypothetical protein [Burkholderiales bacterium 8X]|nr:conserved hypothetical protein [Burkholderiales bacterium 8X]
MASITSTGIGSGLDVSSIISQLMALEKQPLTRLQTAGTVIDTKISAFGSIKSQVSALADVAKKLADPSSWNAKAATSSNTTAVTASVSDGTKASPTSFSLEVQQLARSQSIASAALATGTSTGTGTLTLQFGGWNAGSFTADGASTPLKIEIGAGEDSVAAVAAKINAAGAGVVATVITDDTGQRLLLRSKGTGEASGFRVQVEDADGNNADDAGLSRFGFDPQTGAFGMGAAAQASATQYGQNAKATVNGIPVVSQSNTLSDTIPGLSLALAQVTTTPVEVKVAVDSTALTKLANDFVTAYNATNGLLNEATSYDAENKQGALLQGDGTTIALQNALRRVLGTSSEGGGAFTLLSQIGIGISAARNGSISLDGTKFSNALKNPADLQALFSADTGNPATEGFGRKLKALTDTLVGTGGAIDSKTTSLTAQRKSNAKDQDNMNLRLVSTEARIRKQYSALDGQMASFNALSSYITNQVAQWNKATS